MKKFLAVLLFTLAPIFIGAQTSEVNLVWEAQTYAPPWYQGRTLPTAESLVRVVAMTQIKDPIFHWRKDGLDIRSASGPGKNAFDFRASQRPGSENLIEVSVTRPDRSLGATSATRVPVAAPKIVFYEVTDGQIDYRQALKNLNIITDQTKIIAEPFYFSLTDWFNRRLTFNWSANQQKIEPATEDPRYLTLVTSADSGAGETMLDLKITNAEHPLQTASAKLPVAFGQAGFGF